MDYPTGTDVTRTYLANDAPATLTDHTGTYNWSYDARGLVTQAQAPQGTLDLLYDATRQRTNVTRPGIGGTSYGRDDAGRVVSVTNRFTEVTSLTLDAGGRLTEQVNANGTKVLRGYDAARGWVSWMEHRRSDNSLLSRYDHTRDAVGNITRLTATNDYQVDFTFDNTYQLTREVRTGNIPYSHRQEGPGREHRSGLTRDGLRGTAQGGVIQRFGSGGRARRAVAAPAVPRP